MSVAAEKSVFTKDNPFPAVLRENRLLNRPGSAKETRHYVVDVAGSGLTYKVGDSLGIFSTNRREDVADVLEALGATGEELVELPKAGPLKLQEALFSRLALASPTRKVLELLSERASDAGERARLQGLLAPENKEATATYLQEREFGDLLAEFPSARPDPQSLVNTMRRLQPRLYSIASSPKWFPAEIHLTVATVRYTTNNRSRVGVCSSFLADRAVVNETRIPVFVSNSHFGVPEDGGKDIIMVGPGTGIAPFRAFVQERVATGATGRNWLFFGDQHRATDYLYEEEWIDFLNKEQLYRADLAFSRDQAQKVYVQNRLIENAAELWSWIRAGAYFYVCGDAKRMAKDVDAALHRIIEQGLTPGEAAEYVKQMKKEKRYQRDVY